MPRARSAWWMSCAGGVDQRHLGGPDLGDVAQQCGEVGARREGDARAIRHRARLFGGHEDRPVRARPGAPGGGRLARRPQQSFTGRDASREPLQRRDRQPGVAGDGGRDHEVSVRGEPDMVGGQRGRNLERGGDRLDQQDGRIARGERSADGGADCRPAPRHAWAAARRRARSWRRCTARLRPAPRALAGPIGPAYTMRRPSVSHSSDAEPGMKPEANISRRRLAEVKRPAVGSDERVGPQPFACRSEQRERLLGRQDLTASTTERGRRAPATRQLGVARVREKHEVAARRCVAREHGARNAHAATVNERTFRLRLFGHYHRSIEN